MGANPNSQPKAGSAAPDRPPQPNPAKSPVASLEARGIIIIAILVLILTLIRYGRHIPWSAR